MAKSEIQNYNAESMVTELSTQHTNLTKKAVKAFVTATNKTLIAQLSQGVEIGINNFGSFTFREQAGRQGTTPKGVAYSTESKNVIKFNVGKEFAEKVAETTGSINRPTKSAEATADVSEVSEDTNATDVTDNITE